MNASMEDNPSVRYEFSLEKDVLNSNQWVMPKSTVKMNNQQQLLNLKINATIVNHRVYDSYTRNYQPQYRLKFTIEPIPTLFYFVYFQKCIAYFNHESEKFFTLQLVKNNNQLISDEETFTTIPLNTLKLDVTLEMFYKYKMQTFLIKDIGKLLYNDEFSDLEIISEDNKDFKVQKCILSVRSAVLHKMISTDMLEKKSGIIELKHWHSNVIRELLNYIYTGECNLSIVPHDLFRLSHYLQITDLQKVCLNYLELNLNNTNIVQSLKLCYEFECDDLMKKSYDLVRSSKRTLMKDPIFFKYFMDNINMKNITLALELLKEHKEKNFLLNVLKFIKSNHLEVMKIKECKKYLIDNPDLLLEIFKCLLDL